MLIAVRIVVKKKIFRCMTKNHFVPWILASVPDFEHRIECTNILSSGMSLSYTGEEDACFCLYSSDQ
jgi:desulfoferrodoxin (superoxide reductase-like protein)